MRARVSRGRSLRVESSDCTQVLSCFSRAHLRASSLERGPVGDHEIPSGRSLNFAGSLLDSNVSIRGDGRRKESVTEVIRLWA